ncbi:hypothetical protein QU481_23665 [Crenobacter sp. SG2303]|uniref:Uncharacterized protein n=1 Tax=Crenobacter oryzisoli TaxID=3056844 RepID=A0ABT7XVI7_9NEIS|nr:hypothetical protein [Crenobacter sp. SG2303]MDN0077797.1 hypothetical protein [Crenobacter sp. SG2303]
MSIEFLKTTFEKVSYLQNLLIAHATGKPADQNEYEQLRNELLNNSEIVSFLPSWLKLHRNLESLWGFIQPKFKTYAERRAFLSQEFTPALDLLEFGSTTSKMTISTSKKSDIPNFIARNKRKVGGLNNQVQQG